MYFMLVNLFWLHLVTIEVHLNVCIAAHASKKRICDGRRESKDLFDNNFSISDWPIANAKMEDRFNVGIDIVFILFNSEECEFRD